jgi:flagellum-specific peptidoglycan hydrolase FlgJ
MTTAEFLKSIAQAAARVAADGAPINPQGAAAHAANESANGKSRLARDAHNLWGVKATGKHTPYWQGDAVTMPTWEVIDGKNVTVDAPFRAYRTIDDCLGDYGDIIQRVYPGAVAGKAHAAGFLAGLFLTGPRKWATDPAAFDKCARILGLNHDVLYPEDEGAWGQADTLVLHGLRLAERWAALTRDPAVLRGRYVWRARGHKLDVRRAG